MAPIIAHLKHTFSTGHIPCTGLFGTYKIFPPRMFCQSLGSGVIQLAEQSLPTPEVRGSNAVNDKSSYRICVYCQLLKRQNNENEAGNGPLKITTTDLQRCRCCRR